MKHQSLKCIILAFIVFLPVVLSAQSSGDVNKTITITGKDTILNGKKLSELSKPEVAALRKELKETDTDKPNRSVDRYFGRDISIKKRLIQPHVKIDTSLINEFRFDHQGPETRIFKFQLDTNFMALKDDTTIMRHWKKMDGLDERISIFPRGDISVQIPNSMHRFNENFPELPPLPFRDKPGTQNFNYNFIDKDGIANRMVFRLSEASSQQLKHITGSENITKMDVEDITLFPNFSKGTMTISFNITNKGSSSIKVLDSDYKTIFSDQSSSAGNYFKQISMPKNGIYFLHIKQGNTAIVKRIIKE